MPLYAARYLAMVVAVSMTLGSGRVPPRYRLSQSSTVAYHRRV